MAIPRKALLLEELAVIDLRTLEARNSGCVRGKFEVSTCSLTKFQHVVETPCHCGKLVWRSKGMSATLVPSTVIDASVLGQSIGRRQRRLHDLESNYHEGRDQRKQVAQVP